MIEVICPKCGSKNIYIGDCFDTENCFDSARSNYVMIRHMDGTCEDCGTNLIWQEVYELVGAEKIGVID